MLSFFVFDSPPLLYFLAGVFSAFLGACLWRLGTFLLDLRETRRVTLELAQDRPHDARGEEAWNCVKACRKRLRLNPNPNPEWVGPLVVEIPRLASEIAAVYYPNHPEPLHAPKVSEFARAIQFASMDIAEILQSKRMGRLIDVSAGRTVQAYRMGRDVWKHEAMQKARRWLGPAYKFAKPAAQILRFNSPITWASVAASNAAVRTIQPAIINIVARHTIDLYSGRLASAEQLLLSSRGGDSTPAFDTLNTRSGLVLPDQLDSPPPASRRERLVRKLKFWRKKKT